MTTPNIDVVLTHYPRSKEDLLERPSLLNRLLKLSEEDRNILYQKAKIVADDPSDEFAPAFIDVIEDLLGPEDIVLESKPRKNVRRVVEEVEETPKGFYDEEDQAEADADDEEDEDEGSEEGSEEEGRPHRGRQVEEPEDPQAGMAIQDDAQTFQERLAGMGFTARPTKRKPKAKPAKKKKGKKTVGTKIQELAKKTKMPQLVPVEMPEMGDLETQVAPGARGGRDTYQQRRQYMSGRAAHYIHGMLPEEELEQEETERRQVPRAQYADIDLSETGRVTKESLKQRRVIPQPSLPAQFEMTLPRILVPPPAQSPAGTPSESREKKRFDWTSIANANPTTVQGVLKLDTIPEHFRQFLRGLLFRQVYPLVALNEGKVVPISSLLMQGMIPYHRSKVVVSDDVYSVKWVYDGMVFRREFPTEEEAIDFSRESRSYLLRSFDAWDMDQWRARVDQGEVYRDLLSDFVTDVPRKREKHLTSKQLRNVHNAFIMRYGLTARGLKDLLINNQRLKLYGLDNLKDLTVEQIPTMIWDQFQSAMGSAVMAAYAAAVQKYNQWTRMQRLQQEENPEEVLNLNMVAEAMDNLLARTRESLDSLRADQKRYFALLEEEALKLLNERQLTPELDAMALMLMKEIIYVEEKAFLQVMEEKHERPVERYLWLIGEPLVYLMDQTTMSAFTHYFRNQLKQGVFHIVDALSWSEVDYFPEFFLPASQYTMSDDESVRIFEDELEKVRPFMSMRPKDMKEGLVAMRQRLKDQNTPLSISQSLLIKNFQIAVKEHKGAPWKDPAAFRLFLDQFKTDLKNKLNYKDPAEVILDQGRDAIAMQRRVLFQEIIRLYLSLIHPTERLYTLKPIVKRFPWEKYINTNVSQQCMEMGSGWTMVNGERVPSDMSRLVIGHVGKNEFRCYDIQQLRELIEAAESEGRPLNRIPDPYEPSGRVYLDADFVERVRREWS